MRLLGKGGIWFGAPQEDTILGQIASLLDRKAESSSLYGDAADTKTKLKSIQRRAAPD